MRTRGKLIPYFLAEVNHRVVALTVIVGLEVYLDLTSFLAKSRNLHSHQALNFLDAHSLSKKRDKI